MIIVNLKGGLGNQMFQYALGRTLALKNNDVLKLDTESLSKAKVIGNIYRPFDLEVFTIEKNIATREEVLALKHPHGIFSKAIIKFKHKVLRQSNVVFNQKVTKLTGSQYLDGYWQSPLYFENIRPTLLADFTLREALSPSGQILQAQIKSTNSVSIHIRRGDYVQNPRVLRENGICSVTYYKQAVAKINAMQKEVTYFIFSDDMTWVKENLPFKDAAVVYIEDKTLTAPQELYLMSQCKHNIIANSSFSWWAAWLNQFERKMVIAPTPWFETVAYDKNLIPPSWIQLPK